MRKLLLLIVLYAPLILHAQHVVVQGKCVDKNGAPLFNVKIYSSDLAEGRGTFSDENGEYQLRFYQKDTVRIRYSVQEHEEIREVYTGLDSVLKVPDVRFPILSLGNIEVKVKTEDPFELEPLPLTDIQKLPLPSVERTLIYMTPATSNNELTSNYTVRGGNYIENLVYVNGFLIYRPFLTRSGQQEGMSFINTALVESIQFSAGGFDALYGDKLSSVLDIQYKTPDTLAGSLMLSLLGQEAHFEQRVNNRLSYLAGARYRSNGYFLNSLPTKGAYNPVFYDGQFLVNYELNENLLWSVLGHYSSNDYRFIPQTQETDFGTANEAYSFTIYFEGQEQTRFRTMTGATSLKWKQSKNTQLDFYASIFNTNEREYFDVLGQYFINQLETDPSKEEFGDSIAVLGVGSFLNHARNKLDANILNLYHNGEHEIIKGYKDDDRRHFRNHTLKWGANYQLNLFDDVLSEWKMIDSADYSIPQQPADEIVLFETIKGNLNFQSQMYSSFIQLNSIWSENEKNKFVQVSKKYRNEEGKKVEDLYTDTIPEASSRWALSVGARSGYTTSNNEFYVTPRASIRYYPRVYMVKDSSVIRRDVNYHFSTGLYYQPPFYRELRSFSGELRTDVLAQKSFHAVIGTDVFFFMWGRENPFKFSAEAYYKYMWDVNPYEVDNVRVRYFANNDAVAYAYGVDLNLHGEFVEGIESFFKAGFLSTKEDILSDFYYDYFNASGQKIVFGISEDQAIVDSVRVEPGFIPRPTDQWVNFAALVQDRMPVYESFSVQMALNYGSRLPYGPPDFNRYKDTLRMKSYFRVDLGMSYDLFYKKEKVKKWQKNFTDAVVSFEVLNLLGINNVLSKQWVQDVEGKYYSIPNYLTQRRFNLKLIVRF